MSEFNSAKRNIKDVKAYLKKHPDQLQAVLAAEKARAKPRLSLVAELEAQAQTVPTNATSSKTSKQRKNTIFDKEYEVTPDRGHRVKR